MIESLFDAIEFRFNADRALVRSARRVFQGGQAEFLKAVPPYVDVTIGGPSAEFDTYDADIESMNVTFTAFGKNAVAARADEARRNLMRVFDDCDLLSAEFTTVMFHRTGGEAPTIDDGVYQASLTYDVIVQRAVLEPPVRAT